MITNMLKSNSYVPIDTTGNLSETLKTGINETQFPNDTTEVSNGPFLFNPLNPR
jgi:hypothetical protein